MFIYVLFFPLVLKIGIWANGFILCLYLFELELGGNLIPLLNHGAATVLVFKGLQCIFE